MKSVVDVGCGDGSWLFVLQEDYGKDDILGIDGPWIHEDQLNIPKECFLRAPLDESLPIDRKFDMAISLEVAEHLPEARAEGFVEDLTRLAPLVLFSAAVPGQGGTNHVNEQWQDYWIALFGARGFLPINSGFSRRQCSMRRILFQVETRTWSPRQVIRGQSEP